MPEKNTIAVICSDVEDAKYASENASTTCYRLFLVPGQLPADTPGWLRTSDALLSIGGATLDSAKTVAARAALLYSPSWCVALVDTEHIECADQLLREAEREGFARDGVCWACTKGYAVQYGVQGLSGDAPATPATPGLSEKQLVEILSDLVPMFGVRFSPSVAGEWAWVRSLLEEGCETDGETHCKFITDSDDLDEERLGLPNKARVVLLTRKEQDSRPAYTLDAGGGAKVLIYHGLGPLVTG